jgi:subfamily B ATP-binding cassette protein MsbA
MKVSTRLLKYIFPYSGSILLAIIFSLFIALCEMGYISMLSETIDTVKVIDNKGLPAEITFFKNFSLNKASKFFNQPSENTESGWKIYLSDSNDAIKFVTYVALSILAVFVLKGILSFGSTYIMSRVGQKLILNLRREFYDRLVHFPLGFYTEKRAGDIMSRGTNDMSMLQNSVNSLADAVQAFATLLVFLVMMFLVSWQLTLLTAIVFPPAIYVINRFGSRIKKASTRIQVKLADISSYLERTISGVKIIKSFAAEDWEKERFANENKAKYVAAMKRVRLSAYQMPLIEIISAIGMVIVFWFGFWQVITGKLTTGWFIGFIAMVGMVYKPIKTIGTFNSAFQQASASAERIFEILDIQPEIHDAPDAISISRIKGDVELRDVLFSYNGGSPVLNHINLKVNAGESIALVGPSGAGKTTLVNLLMRFYDIKMGEITIDGHQISNISLKSLRSQVGLVPQETILFSGTAKENIAYGRFDATDEEITQSAKSANIHEFIMQLPDGYDTPLGEHGMQLSGGQRQRVSIARAILKDPRILILDEATSSLDTESESLIQEALNNLMKGRTTFIIAHRLSTIMNADRILVLNKGEIVESGTHSQLLALNGLYRKLCDAQFKFSENNQDTISKDT